MSKKQFNTDVATIPMRTLTFKGFLGVDYYHPRQEVAFNRAVEMSNLINRNGVNQKRYGFKQINYFGGYDETNDNYYNCKINGIWTLKTTFLNENNNNIVKTIIHAGTSFYEINGDNLSSEWHKLIINDNGTNKSITINDEKSFGVIRGNRLYILAGMYLVYGSWGKDINNNPIFEIRLVEDCEDTYIPTTTIGITGKGSNISERYDLDEPNMLTDRRINQINCFGKIETQYDDISIYENSTEYTAFEDKKNIKINLNEIVNKTYPFVVNIDNIRLYFNLTQEYSVENISANLKYTTEDISTLNSLGVSNDNITLLETNGFMLIQGKKVNNYYYIIVGKRSTDPDTKVTYNFNGNIINSNTYELDCEINPSKPIKLNGKLLNPSYDYIINHNEIEIKNYLNLIIGENEIEFSEVRTTDLAEIINKCKFGILYTYNELNQFFISGNPDYPNYDWHSSDRYSNDSQKFMQTDYEDLTYFGTESYYKLGAANNAITGYSLLQDNVLAIHKNENLTEPMMWIRKPIIKEITDYTGTKYKLFYSNSPTAITEGAINHECIAKLYNDNLFLSKNGIFKIQLSNNLQSDIRIAVSRSEIVNNRLVKEDLKKATAISYDNRYYLALPNGKIYIADSRFRNQISGELPDTYSYEYWIWDNIPVRLWFVNNGKLGFGTEDGKICIFNEDNYIDYTYSQYDNSLILNSNNNSFTINKNIDIKKNDEITILNSNLKQIVYSNDTSSINTIVFENIDIDDFITYIEPFDGFNAYIYYDDLNNTRHLLENIDLKIQILENSSFQLLNNKEPFRVQLNNIKKLYIVIYTNNFQVKEVINENDENKIIYLYKSISNENKVLSFLEDNESKSFKINHNKNVMSYWLTPTTNFNYPNINKSIYQFIYTPIHSINSIVNISFITRNNQYIDKNEYHRNKIISDGSNFIDYNFFDFTAITFNTTLFDVSYSSRKLIRNINFIQFKFESDSPYNYGVQEFTVEYKLLNSWKGVH